MNKEELKHLAKLSFINLNEEEQREFVEQLNNLFIHIEKTLKQNIDDIEETERYLTLFHNDMPKREFDNESMLINVKNEKNGYIVVPKIIKEEN